MQWLLKWHPWKTADKVNVHNAFKLVCFLQCAQVNGVVGLKTASSEYGSPQQIQSWSSCQNTSKRSLQVEEEENFGSLEKFQTQH